MFGVGSDRGPGRGVIGGAAAVLVLALLGASTAHGTTLEEAMAAAYLNNPQLQSQRATLRATDEQVPQALSGWRPNIFIDNSIGGTRERNRIDDAPNTFESRVPRSSSLTISQPLFRGGRTVAATRQAENTVLAQRQVLLSVEQQVLLNAVTAYMDVVRDQAVLQLNISNEQVLRRQLEATRDRFQVGEVTQTDVAQAESRLSRAIAERVQAEGNLVASRARYREVMGDMPGSLETPQTPANLPSSEEETIIGAANNPEVRAAEYNELALRHAVDVAYGALLPEITLNGDLTTQTDVSSKGFGSDSATIRAQVTIPLYQAGLAESQVREARQQVIQAREEVEFQRRAAAQFATSAWRALQTARAQIASFEDEVRATQIALDGVQQEAQVGARTVLDILDAEQEALNAKVSLVTARRNAIVAAYQVLSATGRLTAQNLALAVPYYNPELHYDEVRDKLWGSGPSIN